MSKMSRLLIVLALLVYPTICWSAAIRDGEYCSSWSPACKKVNSPNELFWELAVARLCYFASLPRGTEDDRRLVEVKLYSLFTKFNKEPSNHHRHIMLEMYKSTKRATERYLNKTMMYRVKNAINRFYSETMIWSLDNMA